VVDPGDGEPLFEAIRRAELELRGVLLTHAHFDHIYGLNRLVGEWPEAKVYTAASGAEMLLDARKNLSRYYERPFVFAYPQNVVAVGEGAEVGPFRVYATPGHNPSCLTFVTNEAVFTGDAHIPGIAVVTNLPKGNKVQAQQSEQKILDLASGKTIYPGHKLP
jgi:glyoxylase-like metal-dependent hydrolase (beta-lactamase superfamily II)